MARRTRAKGRAAKKASTGKRARGGRKPGKWEVVTPDEILTYRRSQGLSRAKLADLLKVSATSIQNWETGRVASRKIQHRLRALIDGQAAPGNSAIPEPPPQDEIAIATTGEIISAYLQTQKALKPEQLTQLVRSVRRALLA